MNRFGFCENEPSCAMEYLPIKEKLHRCFSHTLSSALHFVIVSGPSTNLRIFEVISDTRHCAVCLVG